MPAASASPRRTATHAGCLQADVLVFGTYLCAGADLERISKTHCTGTRPLRIRCIRVDLARRQQRHHRGACRPMAARCDMPTGLCTPAGKPAPAVYVLPCHVDTRWQCHAHAAYSGWADDLRVFVHLCCHARACAVGAPTRATQLETPGCQQHCFSAVPWNIQIEPRGLASNAKKNDCSEPGGPW
jgi:hypothetical protein